MVVGPETIFQAKQENVSAALLGQAIIVGVQDLGVAEGFPDDPVEGSWMFAYLMGSFGDGCHSVGPVAPSDSAGSLFKGAITLEIEGIGQVNAEVSDYACSPARLIQWVTMGITLLPADLVSLGSSKAVLDIPLADGDVPERTLKASIGSLPPIETVLIDNRDAAFAQWNGLKI